MKHPTPILLLILLLLLFLQPPQHPPPDTTIRSDTIFISSDSIPVPYPVVTIRNHYNTIYDTISREVDTAAILAAYFAHRFGHDTIANDTNVFISIDWHVNQNRLISLRPYIALKKPTAIIYQSTNIARNQQNKHLFFVGLGIGRSRHAFGLSPSFMYIHKQKNALSISYDIIHRESYITYFYQLQ